MNNLRTMFTEAVVLFKSQSTLGLTELSFMRDRVPAQLISGPNMDDVDAISNSRVHNLTKARAASQPGLVALSSAEQGRQMTYGELAVQSSQVAHFLRQSGVGKGDAVLVHLERGFEQVVWILGLLEAGACYIVVEKAWPAPRKEAVAKVAKAKAVVTDTETLSFATSSTIIYLSKCGTEIASMPNTPLECNIANDDLAYGELFIYDSANAKKERQLTIKPQSCSPPALRASPRASWSSTPT